MGLKGRGAERRLTLRLRFERRRAQSARPKRRRRRGAGVGLGRGAKGSPTGFVCPARRQWPEFWKAMSVGERRFFSAVSPVEQPMIRRPACDCGRSIVEGDGMPARFCFSACEPAPSAKRNLRPMRGAFRSNRFVLPFCGVARAVAPAARKGAQSAAMRPSGLGGVRGGAPPGAARRNPLPRVVLRRGFGAWIHPIQKSRQVARIWARQTAGRSARARSWALPAAAPPSPPPPPPSMSPFHPHPHPQPRWRRRRVDHDPSAP